MSGQTDNAIYHHLLKDTGVKLILVNFRKFSVENPSPRTSDQDISDQKEIDEGCKQISDYVVHVDPNNLKEAPRRLANCIMKVMRKYLKNSLQAKAHEINPLSVSAQTVRGLKLHDAKVRLTSMIT